jgi:hypothetical protein
VVQNYKSMCHSLLPPPPSPPPPAVPQQEAKDFKEDMPFFSSVSSHSCHTSPASPCNPQFSSFRTSPLPLPIPELSNNLKRLKGSRSFLFSQSCQTFPVALSMVRTILNFFRLWNYSPVLPLSPYRWVAPQQDADLAQEDLPFFHSVYLQS